VAEAEVVAVVAVVAVGGGHTGNLFPRYRRYAKPRKRRYVSIAASRYASRTISAAAKYLYASANVRTRDLLFRPRLHRIRVA
jgi:hypothetical protein